MQPAVPCYHRRDQLSFLLQRQYSRATPARDMDPGSAGAFDEVAGGETLERMR